LYPRAGKLSTAIGGDKSALQCAQYLTLRAAFTKIAAFNLRPMRLDFYLGSQLAVNR